jgi:6-pyruvoyltetrahydropterin/6-carboxytetrahydropterin synthase
MPFFSTKVFSHNMGLSCCYRQWRAESHCAYIHGYALEVKITFTAKELDEHKWVQDFGGLEPVKDFLKETFDHKLLVARDDPKLEFFEALNLVGIAQIVMMDNVGCEAFAKYIFNWVDAWVHRKSDERVRCIEVEVKEHGANSAGYCL